MPPKYNVDIASLFKARPKLRFIKPVEKVAPRPYVGAAGFLNAIQKIDIQNFGETMLSVHEARIMRREQRNLANQKKIDEQKKNYNPSNNPNATSNPKTTMFICNIPDDITVEQVRYELKVFGPVKNIIFPVDINTNKRRNYCFAEYEREDSFRNAMTQGTKLYFHDRKMIVDKERGRTDPNWLPRRLGGGLGAISRRFSPKLSVMEALQCKKKKRYGYKCGVKYRGTLKEYSLKRESRIGLDKARANRRMMLREERKKREKKS
ncbi:U1 snRNP-associated protein Usp101 [Tritrichomonas foetus]|uniref:U1 snRNP-associated protein Usp101 n=1 Tax=Tritrichomonas foetus TaxID=1144522 RepID=A0A1J4K8J5_9EUKA|nr:U1 snRNP-associated protein Usp101 [Tritrichomonas foetus]|eukprot:OHT07531.1 U1 snRNP-associated protein Usp101 [Tritrichomonas foetus]